MRKIDLIVLHCTGARVLGQRAEMIRQWHKSQGWSDIGYHYFIGFDGLMQEGRPVEQVGAHAVGHNTNSIGICLAGLEKNDFTARQFESLKALLGLLNLAYPHAKIVGHNELTDKKACPVYDVTPWKEYFASLPKTHAVASTVPDSGAEDSSTPKA